MRLTGKLRRDPIETLHNFSYLWAELGVDVRVQLWQIVTIVEWRLASDSLIFENSEDTDRIDHDRSG